MATHRPGVFKQQNKAHKSGQHKTKGQLKKDSKGRVSVKCLGKKSKIQGKLERRLQMKQIRKNKREEVVNKKRSKGGGTGCPLLTAIVQLNSTTDTSSMLERLKSCDDSLTVITNDLGITHISVPRFKQRLSFVVPEYGNLYDLLDAAKVADSLLLLVDEEGIDDYGEYCLSCLFAQGLPAPVVAFQNKGELSHKKLSETKKNIWKQLSKRFPEEKLHTIDTEQDSLLILRTLGQMKLRSIKIRENHPHLIAEDVSFELQDHESQCGVLKVSGYVRGQSLSANDLVHLPGWGDFQMAQIDAPSDPYPFVAEKQAASRKNSTVTDVEMSGDSVRVLEVADSSKQQSLQSEVVPDPMEGEQTWPTDEELAQAEAENKKSVRRVPKGTSEYQAAWIVDSDGEEEDDDTDDEDVEEAIEDMIEEEDDEDCQMADEADEAGDEYETLTVDDNENAKYDATINIADEEEMLAKYREERLHVMFPDEIDTPMETNARTRFQKYRGLKSFRTSEWDTKENLPLDYARIYQFENFTRTKKKVLKEEKHGALPGWYVTLHLKEVPKTFMESYTEGKPVVVFGLLQHEQKMTVCNLALHRHHSSRQPIKSKESMVLHVGFRRFTAAPVYSQHTNGDKHKFEKFFPKEGVVVATVYAPVMFPPAPVLMFKEKANGQHDLVATGSLLSVNPDRIIAKRVVLSGHPFKINHNMVVVRYMFFNREDIRWFRPVELRTKWGRRGHIKEALGTHGHMKCVFDGQLKSQDTVLMNLYKRVYPKWTYDCRVSSPPVCPSRPPTQHSMDDEEEMYD